MKCRICSSSDRAAIEILLAQKKGLRVISARFGFSNSAVHRHSTICMAKDSAEKPNAPGGESVRVLDRLYARVERLLRRTERKGDLKNAAVFTAQLNSLAGRIESTKPRPAKARPEDLIIIKVVYDQQSVPPLTPAQEAECLAQLLLHWAQQEPVCSDENTSACVAHLIAKLRSEPLPRKLATEVTSRLKLLLEGTEKGNADEGTSQLN